MQIKSRFEGGGKEWEMEKRPAAARLTGGCAARGEGRRREVGDDPDRWAPPVGEREREERAGLWWAVCGPKASAGPRGGFGWVVFFSFFFLLQINFKPNFQTIFKSNI
jgi:hypothetical protein